MERTISLINQTNVFKKVKNDMNACEDFFKLRVTGHVIAYEMEMLVMSSIDAIPSSIIPSPGETWMKDDTNQTSILMDVVSDLVCSLTQLNVVNGGSKQ